MTEKQDELIVLEEVKFPATEDELKAYSDKHKEVVSLDPELGTKDPAYLEIKKEHIKGVTYRTSIEKSRKRIVDPAYKYMKAANQMAKDLTGITLDAEQRLFAERKKVEQHEQLQIEAAAKAEQARVEEIDKKINFIKTMTINLIGTKSTTIADFIGKLEVPSEDIFQERIDEANAAYRTTMTQLETMYDTAIRAEQADKIEAERKAQAEAEQAERDAKMKEEREAFEAEKAAFREEQEAQARVNLEREEEELKEKQEAEAVEAARVAEAAAKEAAEKEDAYYRECEDKALNAMGECEDHQSLLEAIINGKIPYVKWEV